MNYLIKNKTWQIHKDYDKEKLLYLLIDRPTKITILEHFIWKNNKNQFHRNYDLPAVIWDNGETLWHNNFVVYKRIT